MPDRKLTPMMEFIQWMDDFEYVFHKKDAKEKATELLEKEHQMIVKSYKNGEQNASLPDMFGLTAEQYYTQTYKS